MASSSACCVATTTTSRQAQRRAGSRAGFGSRGSGAAHPRSPVHGVDGLFPVFVGGRARPAKQGLPLPPYVQGHRQEGHSTSVLLSTASSTRHSGTRRAPAATERDRVTAHAPAHSRREAMGSPPGNMCCLPLRRSPREQALSRPVAPLRPERDQEGSSPRWRRNVALGRLPACPSVPPSLQIGALCRLSSRSGLRRQGNDL